MYCIGGPFYDGDVSGFVVTAIRGRAPELFHSSQACLAKLHVQTTLDGSPVDSYFTIAAL